MQYSTGLHSAEGAALFRPTRTEMKALRFDYIEVFYNRTRLHSTLGYKSPQRFLEGWLKKQQQEKQVA